MTTLHDVISPINEQTLTQVPALSASETVEAITRSQKAFESWKKVSPADRAKLLRNFASKVEANIEVLAKLEVENAGHTIGNARWEANNVVNVLNYYAGAPERLFGRQIPVPGGVDMTFREPIGVVGIIVPWNFPMPIAGWGFAPALAAGCTVVLKPAEVTPLTAMKLAELGLEAGLPENVFQVVTGSGKIVGETLVQDPRVRKIVFTGSTEIGTQIMAKCAPNVKRVTLELGGKSANVIFADSDLEKAAASAPGSVFDNAGQDCCARSRLLIEKSAFDKFMPLLEKAVKAFKCADPFDSSTEMGPLITKAHKERVASYVEESLVAFRGSAPSGTGFWFPPTVLHIKDRNHRALREEIFGPVVSVVTFEDEADAINLANDSEFGLSGSIWTNNGAKALRVARGIESGNLSVNSHSSVRYWTPFGGFKKSGLGRELGPDALNAFTEEKNVFINTEI
ncbi:MAG: aldehyde dehydrogenase family protein [Candidatus Nanopelagicales bacterium]